MKGKEASRGRELLGPLRLLEATQILHLATLLQTDHRVTGCLSATRTTKIVGNLMIGTDIVREAKVGIGVMTDEVGTEAGIDKEGTHLTTGITTTQVPAPNGVLGARKDPQKDTVGQIRGREKGTTMIPNKETHRSTNLLF